MKSALTRLERLKTVQVVGERCEERPGARPLSYGESQDETGSDCTWCRHLRPTMKSLFETALFHRHMRREPPCDPRPKSGRVLQL